jgi:hypothetical protein
MNSDGTEELQEFLLFTKIAGPSSWEIPISAVYFEEVHGYIGGCW